MYYWEDPVKSNEMKQRTLSEKEQSSICKRLTEFMVIAREEVDIHESLEGLSEKERETRLRKMFGRKLEWGISEFGYSLGISKGGQSLTISDNFSTTSDMKEWMESLGDEEGA